MGFRFVGHFQITQAKNVLLQLVYHKKIFLQQKTKEFTKFFEICKKENLTMEILKNKEFPSSADSFYIYYSFPTFVVFIQKSIFIPTD